MAAHCSISSTRRNGYSVGSIAPGECYFNEIETCKLLVVILPIPLPLNPNFTNYSCKFVGGQFVKDLSKVLDTQDLSRVVLVDNNPHSFVEQVCRNE